MYTRMCEELFLIVPPTMIFNSLTTCGDYFDGLKSQITRQVDFYCRVNLIATFNKEENALCKANSLLRSQKENEKPLVVAHLTPKSAAEKRRQNL